MNLAGLFTADNLAALLTLTALEIVLGIDNIIFIAILVGRLPEGQRNKARLIGLFLAMFVRIALLFAITWVMSLDKVHLFTLPWVDHAVSGKDLVLLLGGLFLVGKSTYEIHHKLGAGGGPVEAVPHDHGGRQAAGLASALVQIILLDIVFSLDSVITAVGMAKRLEIMVAAVVIAVGVMLVFSGFIARFVERNPTIKMLALAFLILIGVMLIAEGSGQHVNKAYIYVAMAFSLAVELLNMWASKRAARAKGRREQAGRGPDESRPLGNEPRP